MLAALLKVNWLAVLVCGIALMVVGFIWYTVFAKQWGELSGWTREKVATLPRNEMMMSYGITFVAALVMVTALAMVLRLLPTPGFRGALAAAAVVWTGFTAAPALTNTAFEHRPWKLFLLQHLNHLVGLLVSSVILTLWK